MVLIPLLASVPIAITALLVTGDVDLSRIFKLFEIEETQSVQRIAGTIERYVGILLVGSIVIGLMPVLRPQRLIESGKKSSGPIERTTYWITSRALLFGLPLLIFGFIARENISRFNEERGDLRTADIRDLEAFWLRIHQDAKAYVDPVDSRPEKEIGARLWITAWEWQQWRELPNVRQGQNRQDEIAEVEQLYFDDFAALSNPTLVKKALGQNELWGEFQSHLATRYTVLPRDSFRNRMLSFTSETLPDLGPFIHVAETYRAEATEISDQLWLPQRWLHLTALCLTGNTQNPVSEIVRLRTTAKAQNERLYAVLTGVLRQPGFHKLPRLL